MRMIRYGNPMLNDYFNLDHWFDQTLRGMGLMRGASDAANAGRRGYRPLADAYEDEGNYIVRFELPGVSKEDVTVEMNDSVVTVKGERKDERAGAESAISFTRSVQLPEGIDSEKAEAKLEKGILVVSFPKREASTKKLISVA